MVAGLLLPVYVVSDMFGLYAYRKEFNPRVLAIIAVSATGGIAIGWATAAWVDENAVKLIIGLIGLAFIPLGSVVFTHVPIILFSI